MEFWLVACAELRPRRPLYRRFRLTLFGSSLPAQLPAPATQGIKQEQDSRQQQPLHEPMANHQQHQQHQLAMQSC